MPYKDPEKQRKWQALRKRRVNKEDRIKVLDLLGNKCIDCGITDLRVLEVDHIEPILRGKNSGMSGSNHLKDIRLGKVKLDNLQLLCANCHRIKTYNERWKYSRYIQEY